MSQTNNRYDYGIQQPTYSERLEATFQVPSDLTLDLALDSEMVADNEFASSLDPERLDLVRKAYSILHVPGNLLAESKDRILSSPNPYQYEDEYRGGGKVGVRELYAEAGGPAFVQAFKDLLQLEEGHDFEGIEPVIIPDTERTSLEDYLEIASEGGIVIAAWDNHDVNVHLMGALLAAGEVSSIAEESTKAYANLSRDEQEKLGEGLDTVTDQIRSLWQFPNEADKDKFMDVLATSLQNMCKVAKLNYGIDDILYAVDAQVTKIDQLRKKRLYVNRSKLAASEHPLAEAVG